MKEYIQKADLITLQIGANDALIRTIVALGEATNWKSEKLANSMVTGMFRNLTPDNIDYFMDCLKQLTLTPSEFRAVMYLLTTGMGQICTSTYADTVTQLERVMKDLRELNPEAQILVLSYNNPVPLMHPHRAGGKNQVRELRVFPYEYLQSLRQAIPSLYETAG